MSSRYSKPSLQARLLAYSAAAGAVLAAPTADAQVTYNDFDDISMNAGDANVPLDLNGDGTDDVEFAFATGSAPGGQFFVQYVNGSAFVGRFFKGQTNTFQLGEPLATGAPISAGRSFVTSYTRFGTGYLGAQYPGDFPAGESFLGFRFDIDGSQHFGWLRVNIDATGASYQVLDGAYEATAGAAISAGAMGVAVEPDALPDGYLFSPIGPNPIRSSAQFTVQVAEPEAVRVSMYDLLGREVAEVFNGELASGVARRMELQVSDLPAGTYVVRVTGETFDTTRRVTVAH